jgi:hypothetical protein
MGDAIEKGADAGRDQMCLGRQRSADNGQTRKRRQPQPLRFSSRLPHATA